MNRSWKRRKAMTVRGLQQPWLRAVLYVACIPLFPEYIAPVLAMLALFDAYRDARADHRCIVLGTAGKLLLSYIVYMALGLAFAKMVFASVQALALWIFMFVAYLALSTVLSNRKRLDTALYTVSLVAGVVGLVGCIQYFLRFIGVSAPLQLWEPLDRLVYSIFPMNINIDVTGTRVSSTFSNPNIVGQYLVLITPITAYYAFHGERQNRRTLCRFCLLASIGCAAFTFSRGTYLALLMVALVLAIANIRNIVTLLLSLLSALLLVPDAVWSRLMSVGRLDASSLERLNVWKLCIGLIAQNPLFGTGCGVQYTWNVMLANGIRAPHAHNIVLQLLVEGGIIGLCFFLFLGFRVVQSALTLINRQGSRALGITLLAIAVGFCTNGMVEYGLTFPKVMSTFALVAAVTDVVCCLQLDRSLSPLKQAVTLGGRLLGRNGATVSK